MKKALIPFLSLILVTSGCGLKPTQKLSPNEQYAVDWTKGFTAFKEHNLSDDEFFKLMCDSKGFKEGWQKALAEHLKLHKKGYDDAKRGKKPAFPLDHESYMTGYAKGMDE